MFGKWMNSGKKIIFPTNKSNKSRKIRIVGQDWDKHIKAVLVPELKKWWPKHRRLKTKKNQNGVEYLWTDVATGSTLEIMSNGQDSDFHEGWSGDLILYDEPPKRDIRVANARGLVDREGRELFCMTLLKEAWVDREVIKAVDKDGKPDMTVFSIDGDIYANVGYGITQKGVEQLIKTLKPEEIEARINGKPSYMSGLVYPEFSRKANVVEHFKIPSDWITDIAIDIHPKEPQAVLFKSVSPHNYHYLCYHIWEHGNGQFVGDEIIRVINTNAFRVGRIIIDPLSKGDSNNDNSVYDEIETVLFRFGYELEVATKDKTAGILDIKDGLLGPNKIPSLFFFDTCVRAIWEIEGYMYKDGKPVDKDDHFMENLYRLMLLKTQWSKERPAYAPEEVTDTGAQSWMGA